MVGLLLVRGFCPRFGGSVSRRGRFSGANRADMPTPAQVLRRVFQDVFDSDPYLTRSFYELFLGRYPQVQSLFKSNDPKLQGRMLREVLVAIIDHLAVLNTLDSEYHLADTLRALGERHVAWGVTPEMYDWFGECLRETVQRAAGEAWTERVDAAFSDAYDAVVALMTDQS